VSRIFEALQRSEAERAGVAQPEPFSLATELLRNAERGLEDAAGINHHPGVGGNGLGEGRVAEARFEQFQTLPIHLAPNSRLICLTDKESLGAEKFRFLSVRLRQLQQTRPLKKLLITSTIPEEGKSMVSGNLAAVLSRKKQQKILLLEGDLRRPVLASRFGLGKLPGLTEWLHQEPAPITSIYRLEGLGLWFLPAGKPSDNPLELMQSGRLSALMDQLAAWFDWVIIDSPPVLPLADTSLWMRLADGILLVAREGVTQKKQLQKGLEILESSKLLGMVLNSSSNSDHENYYQRYSPSAPPAEKDAKQVLKLVAEE
jgi:capsular exopolysaccharide synthesis family protein